MRTVCGQDAAFLRCAFKQMHFQINDLWYLCCLCCGWLVWSESRHKCNIQICSNVYPGGGSIWCLAEFFGSWGWGKLDPELCMHVRARWSSFLPGLQQRRLCKFNMNITNIRVSTFSIRDDSETSGHRISMTHLVIWIGPLCTLFLQRFYPLQSACQWLVKEAKKKVRQDADEAAWANSDSWSEAVDLLELLMCFVPSLCKMSFDWSCWLEISLHIISTYSMADFLPAYCPRTYFIKSPFWLPRMQHLSMLPKGALRRCRAQCTEVSRGSPIQQ